MFTLLAMALLAKASCAVKLIFQVDALLFQFMTLMSAVRHAASRLSRADSAMAGAKAVVSGRIFAEASASEG